jgi:RNA polymerase sigma-70 factor (ECF subfamily)
VRVVADLEARLKALMLRALAGDAAAHRELLHALARRLRAYFIRRLDGDAADTEDLVQETLLAVHTRRATYDPAQPFTAWCLALARYKLIDLYRRRSVRRHVPLDDVVEFLAVEMDTAAVIRADLDRAMEGLNPRQRRLVLDVKIEGHSLAEAGARAGISEGAAKVGLHRAMKALAARVGL